MSERREQAVSIVYRTKDGMKHTVAIPDELVQVCNEGEAIVIDTYKDPIDIRRVKIRKV